MTVPYLGREWGRKAQQVLRNDPRVQEAVQGLKLSILTKITHVPGPQYNWLFAAFDGTGLSDARMGHDGDAESERLPEPNFTIVGPYEVFASIQRGELTEHRALLSGRLHVKGSRLQALRHMGALETVTEVLAEIPCET